MVKKMADKLCDEGSVIYRIDRDRKTGEYDLNSDSSQAKHVATIKMRGFERRPTGMYSSGFGFTNAGSWLFSEFGSKLRLTLSATQPSGIKLKALHERLVSAGGKTK